MKNQSDTLSPCARADDLLAYLYDEASDAAKRDFALHLDACAPCRAEVAAFRDVRADLGAWRSEILRTAPARVVSYADMRQPSLAAAWAAWREFFTLSPLWLRGATALAGLAVAGLLFLAVAQAGRGGSPNQVAGQSETTAPAGVGEDEVQRRIAAAVQAERDGLTAQHARELEALKLQNQNAGQRLAALQAELKQAQANVPEPRIIKVRVPAPAQPRSRGNVANGGNRPAPVEDEKASTLAEVMFGGNGGSRR
jgi:hypothetical protein